LLLAGFVLGASSVAEARIPQMQHRPGAVPDVLAPNVLSEVLNRPPAAAMQSETKTISLSLGPLHFQEVLKDTPNACRS
jgi:hypothetical protein